MNTTEMKEDLEIPAHLRYGTHINIEKITLRYITLAPHVNTGNGT
jgi:hypothetical protein